MSFDITSVLKGVSGSDTGMEQISYLPVDKLDPDENNFYSLEGIDRLADNIATIGLQQPIRVRPGSEAGRYTIVSGHRRLAAIQILLDSEDGSGDQFRNGVPCIVETGKASAALQELRLIFANASTRIMGPAEISRQAERVEALLYQLKEEGMDFPGRMRDHVAEACQVSKTKIARLHAIRANLDPVFLKYFDNGELAEETAYQLQRLPKEIQAAAGEQLASGKRKIPTSEVVTEVNRRYEKLMAPLPCRAHAGCPDCHHKAEKVVRSIFQRYSWDVCDGEKCCQDCYKAASCSGACRECKDRRALDKTIEAEKAAKAEEDRAAQQKVYQQLRKNKAKRLLPLIEAAGLEDGEELPGGNSSWNPGTKVSDLKAAAAGEFGDRYFYDADILPNGTKAIAQWADKLRCSVDFLLGRTDDPRPVSNKDASRKDPPPSPSGGLQWSTGKPTEFGIYELRVGAGLEETPQTAMWSRMEWTENGWAHINTGAPMATGITVFRWVKLPEV